MEKITGKKPAEYQITLSKAEHIKLFGDPAIEAQSQTAKETIQRLGNLYPTTFAPSEDDSITTLGYMSKSSRENAFRILDELLKS